MPKASPRHFVYHQSMPAASHSDAVSGIAAAIGEPARARMLYALLDGHARTATELALAAGVSPSTSSVHLNRLKDERLVKVAVQGKHRYYSLESRKVATALEGLSVLAGTTQFVPTTPVPLRAARTCYDHMAGALGVALLDAFVSLRWLKSKPARNGDAYIETPEGLKALAAFGIDVREIKATPSRRRFAYACLDWSERRPHLAGALGAAVLNTALKRRWVLQDLNSRALDVTPSGRRELKTRFGISA
jgi:DNA-binding transcriptional ArsR family regulator